MRAKCLEQAIALAQAKDAGPVARIVRTAIEVGAIVPSILTKALSDAGYVVSYRVGPGEDAKEGDAEVGSWVLITMKGKKGPVVVARAYSHDKGDALLQAIYAWLKEEAGAASDSIVKV